MKQISNLFFACLLFSMIPFNDLFGQGEDWHVWVKISPCSGRFDWITVAKTNPAVSGTSFYYRADQLFPGTGCTAQGCSFATAAAVANSLKPSTEFSKYCCRDYSVWRNQQTGKMTVVVGKFATPGAGFVLVKTDMCCEEAEALAGIPGACSGTTQQQKAGVQCWPGSHEAWNAQTKRTECFCNQGLVWNATKTACVDPKTQAATADCSVYPGSYSAWNDQTQRVECFCPQGKIWNTTRTACVDAMPQVQCYPGSYAAYNAQTKRTECFCNTGLVWNATRTGCITTDELVRSTSCAAYPGSYAAWNDQTKQVECFCPQGKTWNATKTACVDAPTSQVQCYPGSYAAFNTQTNRTECFCNPGLVWNATKTACVDPNTVNNSGFVNPGGGPVWTLVSVTSSPNPPSQGWSSNASGGTAHVDVYNGDKADFQWSQPPQQFGMAGFTIQVATQGYPTPGNRIACLIGVSADGMQTVPDHAETSAQATPPAGPASASRTIVFKPYTTNSDIEVNVGLMWGSLVVKYKYKRN